jgi:hypothetical protein
MAITVTALHPNPTIQTPDLSIYSGIVECVFKGNAGGIARDRLSFTITAPPVSIAFQPPQLSCVISLASFAYDGAVTDALWAVDSSSVTLGDYDRGSGTAPLQVGADLAVRGSNGIIMRVNYSIFVRQ